MLTVKNVSFQYTRRTPVLRDLTLTIENGRTVILGPNGAGKSTLLRVLAGAQHPTGKITLDGVAVGARPSKAYRRAVGWLPQDVSAFAGLSAREHVSYICWLKGMSRRRAWDAALDALGRVGLEDRADHRADRLSGDQTRRLGIASCVAHGAKYLLLDEPTAGLDPRERERLGEVLDELEATHAVVISTHDTDFVVTPRSRVVLLLEGAVSFNGDVTEFVGGQDLVNEPQLVRRAYASYAPEG